MSDVYRVALSAQIQTNAAKLIPLSFTVQMDNDPERKAKATGEKRDTPQWPSQSPDANSVEQRNAVYGCAWILDSR